MGPSFSRTRSPRRTRAPYSCLKPIPLPITYPPLGRVTRGVGKGAEARIWFSSSYALIKPIILRGRELAGNSYNSDAATTPHQRQSRVARAVLPTHSISGRYCVNGTHREARMVGGIWCCPLPSHEHPRLEQERQQLTSGLG